MAYQTALLHRTPEQVKERLDRLIQDIVEIQKPHMHGAQAADVLVVRHRLSSLLSFVEKANE
jgi:GTP1/Obg family GTP-binding protein